MKNLCFLCFNIEDMGGVNRVISSLCNKLSQYGYSVCILSICGNEGFCPYKLNASITTKSLGADPSWRLRKIMMFSFKKIINYINSNNIHLAFIVGHYVAAITFLTKPFIKSKLIFCDHGALTNQLVDKKATLFRKIACKISDKTIVLTKRTLSDYKTIFHIKDNKIDYIYNWVDDEIFNHICDYNTNSKKIVTAGRFGPEKGFDMLVDVADIVLKKHPDWTWDLFGYGEEFEKVKNLIYEKGLENNLILKGQTDNMYDKYKDYAMYVLPSYREGLPLVLLEAKANHLPIVSFDVITGPREIVQDNIDGFLIDCYDKKQMADKICKLIENQELREQFSSHSYDNINLFRKENIINKWIKLINSLS